MRSVAQRTTPADPPDAPVEHAPEMAAPTAMVVWVQDGPVCVGGADLPAPCPPNGVCHCPACHAPSFADLAVDFFPAR